MKKIHHSLFTFFIISLFMCSSVYARHYLTIKLDALDLSKEKISIFDKYKKINGAYSLINYAFKITTPEFQRLGIGAGLDVRDLYHHDKAVKFNLVVITKSKIKEKVKIPLQHRGPDSDERKVLGVIGVSPQEFCQETITQVFDKLSTREEGEYRVKFNLDCDETGKMKGDVTIERKEETKVG